MLENLIFVYDGIRSDDMGLYNVKIGGNGLYEETFVATKSIIEQKVRGKKPIFQGVEREPLSLPLQFAFIDNFDEEKIREVARWLDQDFYKEFYMLDNEGRRFFCMLDSDSKLLHNGLQKGYVDITMRCDSPYSYSPEYLSEIYDYTTNVIGGTDLIFENHGDEILEPELWIKKHGAGSVEIANKANGVYFQIANLEDQELVYFDNERRNIVSDAIQDERYDDFNGRYLQLERGRNILTITGSCEMQFRYRFKTKQG